MNVPFLQTQTNADFITIYDGSNDEAIEIAKLSGNLDSFEMSSTKNSIFVKFESDESGFWDQNTGFIATIYYGNSISMFEYQLIIKKYLLTLILNHIFEN